METPSKRRKLCSRFRPFRPLCSAVASFTRCQSCSAPVFVFCRSAEAAMSKSDFPPSYSDLAPLVANSDCSEPPPYNYGTQFPQAIYATPGYHPCGLQPPSTGQYEGQPTVAHPSDAGYPAVGLQMVVAPVPAPVISPDVVVPVEEEVICTAHSWESLEVRHAFVRKVYLILACQFLVTLGIVAVFVFVAVFVITYLVLICCQGPRRRYPWNLILLSIFVRKTHFLLIFLCSAFLSSYYDTDAVLLAVGITVVVCVVITLFSFQTKVDLTSCRGLFCALAIVLLVTALVASIVLSIKYVLWVHMLYAAVGAVIYTLFLAYDTQLLIGRGKYALSPEEYVFGALILYIDIVQLFLFLLQLIGGSSK
ncbi:protein lifeguard 3-like [Arapaima gigas]